MGVYTKKITEITNWSRFCYFCDFGKIATIKMQFEKV
jgi:hypothetical protein